MFSSGRPGKQDTFSDGIDLGREIMRSRYAEDELRKCGVKTFERKKEVYPSTVTVVPVEIQYGLF